MKIRQIRNATLRINFGGVEFLTDPWLVSKAEGFTFGRSPFASEVVDSAQLDIVMPMCELPIPVADVLSGVEAYVLTHLHPDHFDMAADGSAGAKLDKTVPLFVQNEDEVAVMKRSGFKDVRMFTGDGVAIRGVSLKRTFARHGTKTPCGQRRVYLRLYSGTLRLRDTVALAGREKLKIKSELVFTRNSSSL